ncbi:MAG TPA: proton-conducting transporter membrane subunit [Bacteroidales bacterium]|mgnify:CR=1 FL=1|nr:proton-conducting transporter membrane subunit [Bacteroidales bacterium]
MILVYFITIMVIAALLMLIRKRTFQFVAMPAFAIIQVLFTCDIFVRRQISFSDYFRVDALGLIFLTLLAILTVTTIIQSLVYLEKRKDTPEHRAHYLASMIIFIGSMTGVFMSDHLGVLWVFAEATTLSIALLIYHERTPEAIEATWKYIFISSIGLSFSFIGILLLDISISGFHSAMFTFSDLQHVFISIQNKMMLQLAFILIVIGFSVKMGVFPLHTVCIDAHSVAPSPVSAMVSTSLMNVGFVAIFRFYIMLSHSAVAAWMNHVLMIIGFLSILFAAIYLVKVKNFKRLIAYSSIENMGLVALAIAAGGIAWFAAVFHLILHTLVKSGVFYQMGQIIRYYKTKQVYLIGGYFRVNPVGGLVMIFAFIILSGIPPSGMFFTEFMIFSSMFSGGYTVVAVLVMLLLCFIIYTLGKYFFKTLFSKSEQESVTPGEKISKWESVPQLIMLLLTIGISIYPPPFLLELVRQAVETLPK